MRNDLQKMLFLNNDKYSNLYGTKWLMDIENIIYENIKVLQKEDVSIIKEHLGHIVPIMLLGYANGSKTVKGCRLDADYFLSSDSYDSGIEQQNSVIDLMKQVLFSSVSIFGALGDENLSFFKSCLNKCKKELQNLKLHREYSTDIFIKKIILKSMLQDIDKIKGVDNLKDDRFAVYYPNLIKDFYSTSNAFFYRLKVELNETFNSQHEIEVFTNKYYNSGEPLDNRNGYYRNNKNVFEDMTISLSLRANNDYLEAFKIVVNKLDDNIENINMGALEMESLIQDMLMKKQQSVKSSKVKIKKF